MSGFDIEAIRAEVRAMDFVRGTPAEVAMWHEDMADSRANLVIEDMIPTPNDDAFFAMMLAEGVPSPRLANPAPAARCVNDARKVRFGVAPHLPKVGSSR